MSKIYFDGREYEVETKSYCNGTYVEARSTKTGLISNNKDLYDYLKCGLIQCSTNDILESYNEYRECLNY